MEILSLSLCLSVIHKVTQAIVYMISITITITVKQY